MWNAISNSSPYYSVVQTPDLLNADASLPQHVSKTDEQRLSSTVNGSLLDNPFRHPDIARISDTSIFSSSLVGNVIAVAHEIFDMDTREFTSNANNNDYISYCRDIITNLIQHGSGIDNYDKTEVFTPFNTLLKDQLDFINGSPGVTLDDLKPKWLYFIESMQLFLPSNAAIKELTAGTFTINKIDDQIGRGVIAARKIKKSDTVIQESPIILCGSNFFSCLYSIEHILIKLLCNHKVEELITASHTNKSDLTNDDLSFFNLASNVQSNIEKNHYHTNRIIQIIQKANLSPEKKVLDSVKENLFELYRKIGDILTTNGFWLPNNNCKVTYLVSSMFNHDCESNCHAYINKDLDIIIRANRDIEKGEELRISYFLDEVDEKCKYACAIHANKPDNFDESRKELYNEIFSEYK